MVRLGKRSAFSVRDEILIWVAADEPPDEAEWGAYTGLAVSLGARRALSSKPLDVLVFSDGAAPQREQRSGFLSASSGIEVRTAVVSGSAIAGGVTAVFSSLQMSTKWFLPNEIVEALAFLSIDPAARSLFWPTVESLAEELGRPCRAVAEARTFLK